MRLFGDDGIIGKAQNATILQSCKELEEYFNEFYSSNFDKFSSNAESKVEALELYDVSKNYIWNPSSHGYGSLNYVVTPDGYKCYFINKSGLPDEIKKSLRGGDAKDGTYLDYVQMNDVYGITSDLKVYYCSEGKNSIMGISEDKLDVDNPNRLVFSSSSESATDIQKKMYNLLNKYDLDNDGSLSASETRKVVSLTIAPESGITSLSELSYLTNLDTLVLENLTLTSLEGLSALASLRNLTFKNTTVGNYDNLSNNYNLEFLCFEINNSSIDANSEIKKLCGTNGDNHVGISKASMSKLKRLCICRYGGGCYSIKEYNG